MRPARIRMAPVLGMGLVLAWLAGGCGPATRDRGDDAPDAAPAADAGADAGLADAGAEARDGGPADAGAAGDGGPDAGPVEPPAPEPEAEPGAPFPPGADAGTWAPTYAAACDQWFIPPAARRYGAFTIRGLSPLHTVGGSDEGPAFDEAETLVVDGHFGSGQLTATLADSASDVRSATGTGGTLTLPLSGLAPFRGRLVVRDATGAFDELPLQVRAGDVVRLAQDEATVGADVKPALLVAGTPGLAATLYCGGTPRQITVPARVEVDVPAAPTGGQAVCSIGSTSTTLVRRGLWRGWFSTGSTAYDDSAVALAAADAVVVPGRIHPILWRADGTLRRLPPFKKLQSLSADGRRLLVESPAPYSVPGGGSVYPKAVVLLDDPIRVQPAPCPLAGGSVVDAEVPAAAAVEPTTGTRCAVVVTELLTGRRRTAVPDLACAVGTWDRALVRLAPGLAWTQRDAADTTWVVDLSTGGAVALPSSEAGLTGGRFLRDGWSTSVYSLRSRRALLLRAPTGFSGCSQSVPTFGETRGLWLCGGRTLVLADNETGAPLLTRALSVSLGYSGQLKLLGASTALVQDSDGPAYVVSLPRLEVLQRAQPLASGLVTEVGPGEFLAADLPPGNVGIYSGYAWIALSAQPAEQADLRPLRGDETQPLSRRLVALPSSQVAWLVAESGLYSRAVYRLDLAGGPHAGAVAQAVPDGFSAFSFAGVRRNRVVADGFAGDAPVVALLPP